MKKIFQVKIGDKEIGRFKDMVIWTSVRSFHSRTLLRLIHEYLDSVPRLEIRFRVLEKNTLGMYWDTPKEEIELSCKLQVDQVPAVLIHELLHAVFPQLDEDELIQKLEKKLCKYLFKKSNRPKLERLLEKAFKKGIQNGWLRK